MRRPKDQKEVLKNGNYIVIDFTSDEAFPQELDRVINITDGVLRSLIVAKGE